MKKFFIVALLSIAMSANAGNDVKDNRWTGTWAAAPQLAAGKDMPAETDLSGMSLRQIVRVSVGGDVLRLQLSNEYSKTPVEIKSVYIADAEDSCVIDKSSAKYLTFGKKRNVTIAAGKAVMSDAVKFDLKPLQRLAITINYGSTPSEATSHLGSRTTSYIIKGVSKPGSNFSKGIKVDHWYNISAIDICGNENSAVAVLGNSITDGRGSTTNMQNRWTDIMATNLQAGGKNLAVLNLGIGGNCVLNGGLGTPAMQRYDRDILAQRGVSAVVIFEGVNDLGSINGNSEAMAAKLIEAYQQLAKKARERGYKVYGATITPFAGHSYFTFFREAARQAVNEWIRTSGTFDDVIDFDKLMRDPSEPSKLKADLQDDWLHPNAAGYKVMGEYAAKIIK